MHELAPLIYDLAIMLGVAAIVTVLFQRIHQPIVLGYLVAGMILGPYTPPYSFLTDIPNIQILSELGVIFLMFALGLEFSFKKLTQVGFSASITGVIEVVLMIPMGFFAGRALGWSFYDSLFLGAALSISSTTIIIKAIEELGLKTKRFAILIFGILVVEDLVAILLLVALSTVVVTNNIISLEMVYAAVKLIIVVGGWFLIGYFLVPPLFRKVAKYLNQETLTIVSIALCLFLVCIAAKFHYSTALGAFIMGSILAETVLIKRIEELIQPIRDIFAAVFFISVGILINPKVIIQEWKAVLLISAVTVIGKLTATSIAALLSGQSLKTSLRVGFGMAQVGEFSFIIVGLGTTLGVVGKELYPVIVAVSAITAFTTPYLIRFSGVMSDFLNKKVPDRFKLFLENYSGWVYRSLSSQHKPSFFRNVSVRLIMNGIIVAIIFTVVDRIIYFELLTYFHSNNVSNLLCLIIALVAASPFIWGMLFSYRVKTLPVYSENSANPAIFIVWLITLAEISIMSIVYFETWVVVAIFLIVASIFLFISYKHLEISYRWFEKQLLLNIGLDKNSKSDQYENLAPWDSYLIEIDVNNTSPLIHKALKTINIRGKYGVNVVGIQRDNLLIPSPRGEEKIHAHDKLIVLGNDEQIDEFEKAIEGKHIEKNNDENGLAHFTLQAVIVNQHPSIIGKSIRESHIREQLNGVVVGLERHNKRILNPDPNTVLKADDVVFVVGDIEKFKEF